MWCVEESSPVEKRWRLLVYGLLWVLFAQVTFAARHTSITLDEPLHIASGYACLVTGDYRLVEEHPPLLKMLQAVPLLLIQPRLPDPRDAAGWNSGDLIAVAQSVVVPYRPIEPLVFASRVPTMLVSLLLATLVYRWAADVFGERAGLLALALYTFDPNMLAHAGVAATDLGAACALFAAMYAFWRWVRQANGPSWRRCLAAGVVFGLSLGVKTTVLVLFPIFGGFILLARPRKQSLKPYLLQALAGGSIAFLILWALYRFEVGAVTGLPVRIPAPSHLVPMFKLREHMRDGHSAFLMGENYHQGVWYYFPIAFMLKTPPLTLALLVWTAIGMVVRRVPTSGWRTEAAVLTLPLVYFGISLTSGINIGYRHLLPVLPFFFVWVSRLALSVFRTMHRVSYVSLYALRFTWGALLSGYVIVTLAIYPWYLAYFNLFAGGPDGGYRYLVDSNLDWGQTWKALRQYLEEQGITDYGLSQYTINDPQAYGLNYIPLPPWPDAPPVLLRRFDPAPGVYAISTTTLQGVVVADSEMFDYFRKIEPVARVGHAMFVYEVKPHRAANWVAQCTVPVAPLPSSRLAEGLGQEGLRLIDFDCSQSWIYPAGSGWYVLSRDYAGWGLARIQTARLAYEQTRPGSVPPFAIYEWFGLDSLERLLPASSYASPGEWSPQRTEAEGAVLTTPVMIGNEVEFLGYIAEDTQVAVGQTTAVQTYWRVVQSPSQPLSLMAHFLGKDGVPVAVGDGLGIPITQVLPGDVIVQRHIFEIPLETAPGLYWLQVGAYTLSDIQRLPVLQHGITVGDRLLAGRIEVIVP
jgi:hypothetical protein